jgi:beta-galactosidase
LAVYQDSAIGAEQPGFDDSKWRVLDLPHDWSIEDLPLQVAGKTIGPFSKESPGGASGHTIGGTGWYRKSFTLDADETGKRISVYFEGAYSCSFSYYLITFSISLRRATPHYCV